ncbi:MAG: hypothetical protein J7M05_03415 [Anaerolineae bacterium]|nr:hypothetical protein [Anaerolineae bacterium]
MKKRIIRLILWLGVLSSMVLLPMLVSAAPPSPGSGSTPVLTAPPTWGAPTRVRAVYGLRLREGPSLAAPVILVLWNGEKVYPGGGPVWNQGISWTYVRVYRWGRYYEGFCASAYLANYGGYSPSGESGLKVIAPIGLRLRSGPGLWYPVWRIVPYGTVLQPTGLTQWSGGLQWTQVAIDGIYLWAASMYLTPV